MQTVDGSPGRKRQVLLLAVLTLALVFALGPILWGLSTSLKVRLEITGPDPTWIPREPTAENYERGVLTWRFARYAGNTLWVILLTAALSLVLSVHAAYAAARFQFRGRRALMLGMWSTIMIPSVAILIPLYLLAVRTGLYNSHLGVVLVFSAQMVPTLIWLLEGFVRSVPSEIEEAAQIDGCSRAGAFYRMTLPLLVPGLIASGVLVFVNVWNEFVLSYALLLSDHKRLIQVGVYSFITDNSIEYGPMMAAAMGAIVPILLLYALLQRSFVQGLTGGSVK